MISGESLICPELSSAVTSAHAVADKRGWPVLHRMHVTQAPDGCDYDFLQARSAEQLAFTEPVIGRS